MTDECFIKFAKGMFDLSEDEVGRLVVALVEYEPAALADELVEEMKCIFGARKLATMPPLTDEVIDRARAYGESLIVKGEFIPPIDDADFE